jgi:hypothetical protein
MKTFLHTSKLMRVSINSLTTGALSTLGNSNKLTWIYSPIETICQISNRDCLSVFSKRISVSLPRETEYKFYRRDSQFSRRDCQFSMTVSFQKESVCQYSNSLSVFRYRQSFSFTIATELGSSHAGCTVTTVLITMIIVQLTAITRQTLASRSDPMNLYRMVSKVVSTTAIRSNNNKES